VNKFGERLAVDDEGSDHVYRAGAGVLQPRDANSEYRAGSQKNFLKRRSGKPMSERASRLAQLKHGEGYSRGQVQTEKTKQYNKLEVVQGDRKDEKRPPRRQKKQSGPVVVTHEVSSGITSCEHVDSQLDSMYKQTYKQKQQRQKNTDVDGSEYITDAAPHDEYVQLKEQSAQNKLLLKFYKQKASQARRIQLQNQSAPGGSSQFESEFVQQHPREGLASAGNGHHDQYRGFNAGNSFGSALPYVSSNTFASGMHQNTGNVLTERPSVKLHAPAGGHSSINVFDCQSGLQPQNSFNRSPIRNVFSHGTRLVVSSNSYASGQHQNTGNTITDRSSTRRMAPPGGRTQTQGLF
jgi:hypothetical protein